MDTGTTKNVVLIITIVAGIVVVLGNALVPYLQRRIDGARQTASQQQLSAQLKQAEERASAELQGVQSTLQTVQSQLEPFVELARQRYPSLDAQRALEKLQSDLTRVEELATRDIAKPVRDNVTDVTLTALRSWRTKNPTTLIAGHLGSADTPNAEAVFSKVVDFLKQTGISFEYRSRAGMTAGRVAPIAVRCHPNSERIAKEFVEALSSYVRGQTRYLLDAQRKQNEIDVTFVGTPKFSNDGRVVIE